jgi:hypothetical protein
MFSDLLRPKVPRSGKFDYYKLIITKTSRLQQEVIFVLALALHYKTKISQIFST